VSQQGDENILRRTKKLPNPARRRKNPEEDEKTPEPSKETKKS